MRLSLIALLAASLRAAGDTSAAPVAAAAYVSSSRALAEEDPWYLAWLPSGFSNRMILGLWCGAWAYAWGMVGLAYLVDAGWSCQWPRALTPSAFLKKKGGRRFMSTTADH